MLARALLLPVERADGAFFADQTAAVAEDVVCGRGTEEETTGDGGNGLIGLSLHWEVGKASAGN